MSTLINVKCTWCWQSLSLSISVSLITLASEHVPLRFAWSIRAHATLAYYLGHSFAFALTDHGYVLWVSFMFIERIAHCLTSFTTGAHHNCTLHNLIAPVRANRINLPFSVCVDGPNWQVILFLWSLPLSREVPFIGNCSSACCHHLPSVTTICTLTLRWSNNYSMAMECSEHWAQANASSSSVLVERRPSVMAWLLSQCHVS